MNKSIEYGKYSCNKFIPMIGIKDSRFLSWCDAVSPHLEGYSLWIYGGILEGWPTLDIDGTLLGPHDPKRINDILENIVRISFEHSIFPDVKFSKDSKLFTWSEYEKTKEPVTIEYAYYKPSMIVDGKHIQWGIRKESLWMASRTWPMKKAIFKKHRYSDPMKLF